MTGFHAWSADAACAGLTPLFFPDDEEPPDSRREREAQAKVYCARCAVAEPCLEWALENNERGIWGNTTEAERVRIRRRHARAKYAQEWPPPRPKPAPGIGDPSPLWPEDSTPADEDLPGETAESSTPVWRTLDTRDGWSGSPVHLAITEGAATWHGFRWAVFRGEEIAFLAEDEADAWMYFHSLCIA